MLFQETDHFRKPETVHIDIFYLTWSYTNGILCQLVGIDDNSPLLSQAMCPASQGNKTQTLTLGVYSSTHQHYILVSEECTDMLQSLTDILKNTFQYKDD